MDNLLDFFIGFILVSSIRVSALYEYITTTDSVTWDNANDSCSTQFSPGHRLVDWRNTTEQSTALTALLTENEIYWTRGYYLKTDFYWKMGCYDKGGEQLSIVTDFKQENSLFKCSTHCERKEFIGLEGTKCHCFSKRPTLGSQSDKTCGMRCPGNLDDTCGDTDKMTIYRALPDVGNGSRANEVSFTEDGVTGKNQDGDCFAINKEDLSSYDYLDFEIFTSHSCQELRSFICESKEIDPITGDIYTKVEDKKTFFEADRYCLSKGNRLAFIVMTNVYGVLNDATPDGSAYWVGLYRQVYRGTVDNGHFNETPYKCEGIRKSGNNLQVIEEQCNATRQTICQIDIEPTTTYLPIPSTEQLTTTQEQTTLPPKTTAEPTTEPPTTSQAQSTLMPTTTVEIVKLQPQTTAVKVVVPVVPSKMATTEAVNVIGDVGKNVADKDEDDMYEESPSWLVILLIILAVIFLIVLILVGFAYRRYRKNKRYQKVSLVDIKYGYAGYGEKPDNVMIVNGQKATPQKPARQNSTKLNDQVTNGEPCLMTTPQQNGLSVPETRDDISWNLPFIDASRNTLDDIDETQPVMVRKSVLLSNSEYIVDGKDIDAGAETDEDDVFQNKSKQDDHGNADGDSEKQSTEDETQPLNQATPESGNKDKGPTSSDSSVEI